MRNLITHTWKKMKSFGESHQSASTAGSITKSKSWNGSVSIIKESTKRKNKKESSPQAGYFTVYVGPTRQRVLVKTKLVNHPLFKNLLEEAEKEYGYIRDGPIVLPCEVDFFFKVLADMNSKKTKTDGYDDDDDVDDDGDFVNPSICGICSPYRSYRSESGMNMRRIGSYKLLRSPLSSS